MVSLSDVEVKLAAVGIRNKIWGRPEIRELCNILTPEEQIIGAVNGSYEHGFAMLVATDHRVLLVDKKPLFLSLEDLRYDMISDVTYSAGILTATLTVHMARTKLQFKSIRLRELRLLTAYMQQHIMEIRQKGEKKQDTAEYQPQIPLATPQTIATQVEAASVSAPPPQPVSAAPLNINTATSIGSVATNYGLRQDSFSASVMTLPHRPPVSSHRY